MEVLDYTTVRDFPAILYPGKAYRAAKEKVIVVVREPAYKEDVLVSLENTRDRPRHIRVYRLPTRSAFQKIIQLLNVFCFDEFKAEDVVQKLGWKQGSAYVFLKRLVAIGALENPRRSIYRVDRIYCQLLDIHVPEHCQ